MHMHITAARFTVLKRATTLTLSLTPNSHQHSLPVLCMVGLLARLPQESRRALRETSSSGATSESDSELHQSQTPHSIRVRLRTPRQTASVSEITYGRLSDRLALSSTRHVQSSRLTGISPPDLWPKSAPPLTI